MAGLQYCFFPTDFYYPRPRSPPPSMTTEQTQNTNGAKADGDLEKPATRRQNLRNINGKATSVSMQIKKPQKQQISVKVQDETKQINQSNSNPRSTNQHYS